MSLRRSRPLPFSPQGLSDSLDSTNVFRGAMSSLQNMIPDPTTKNLWQCRPAAIQLSAFADFSSPGFVSCEFVDGDFVYGLIATSTNANHDEPFCFNLLTSLFVVVTGATAVNTPISPASSGAWVPPTMDKIGTKIMVTHPGFNGTGGSWVGWFDVSNPSAPTWSAGDLTGLITFAGLGKAPSFVKQFGQRAYYLVNPSTGQPSMPFSDVLLPTTVTNANQALTFGDSSALTALGALPLNNQLGGIIQSLIVFKGVSNMYQITGDYAGSTLASNSLNVATGTLSPLSIAATSKGLAFVAPDGLRVIDFLARVSDPIGFGGDGVNTPFLFSLVPSRVAAACNANVYRVSLQNGYASGSPQQEYWFDISRKIWHGPHTFPASTIQAYKNTFIMTPVGVSAKLFQSDIMQSSTSTYVENGAQMTFDWQTCMLPDTMQMSENAMIETTINMALTSGVTITVSMGDQNGSLFDTVSITPAGSPTLWGGFLWGSAVWLGTSNALYPQQLPWTKPIVFRRGYITATGNCASGIKIGDMFMRYEQLGYLQQAAS